LATSTQATKLRTDKFVEQESCMVARDGDRHGSVCGQLTVISRLDRFECRDEIQGRSQVRGERRNDRFPTAPAAPEPGAIAVEPSRLTKSARVSPDRV